MKNIFQVYLVLFVFTFGAVQAQPKVKQQNVTIESVVKDDQGNPVPGALIYGKEGAVIVKTDASGHFTISVPVGSGLLIESEGYESKVLSQEELKSGVSLKPTPYLMGEKDNVHIAFGTVKRGDLTGDVSVVEPDEFVDYDNSQYVPDALAGRIPGMFGSNNIRGLGDAMVVLDGIPRYSRISDININMEEIDQVTVLKDASAVALYGAQARNGVIIITTKRGKANKRTINVSGYYGIAKPKALPKYLGSADYMELYNEARLNDGMPEQYDAETIDNYRTGNPYRYPGVDYYSPEYLKSFRTYSKVLAEFSGGNNNTAFYANLGWGRDGSLMNFGSGKDANSNRFNARANVDFKVNDFIKSNVDIAGIFDFNKGPRGSYYSNAANMRPYLFTPLLPFGLMEKNNTALNSLVNGRKNDVDGLYLLGGTQQNQATPFGDVYSGGYNQAVRRTMQFNNGIDVDLGMLAKGLSLKTNVSFDFYNSYNQSVSNTYSVYEPVWSATSDSITGLKQYGTDSRPGTQNVGTPDFLRRIGFFGQINYERSFSDVHNVSGTLLGFANTVKLSGTLQPDKNTHVGLRLAYNYSNTYFIDFSGAYVNSTQLPAGNRGGFSPTLALAWVISKENFLSGNKAVDYLKLKGSAGIINSDMGLAGYYFYDNAYARSGGYTWADGAWGNSGTYSQRGANSGLGFEKREEINLGLEGQFFNRSVSLDANVFSMRISDKYTRRTNLYPSYYTDFIPYSNYGEDGYSGAELGLTYSKKIRDFSFDLGATAMGWNSKVITKDELYANDYLYRKGHPVDAIFGYQAEGLFQDKNDITNHAFQTFGVVVPGDIKYKDQNNDGVVDANDQVQIGRQTAPFTYGLNIKLSYKNFSLFAIGTGSNRSDAFLDGSYYRPDGDDKYSIIALQRWTEATKTTAAYPRLSSKTNTNNSLTSTFWEYKNNYFSLNRVQLTYDMPEKLCGKLSVKKLSIYVNGSGLAMLSKQNRVRELNIGGEPQYRYFTVGVRTMF
ncbi:MAG: SusC/RagA family TonB-linked outer membrane protein [Bacteroidetes bacterium]|nr:SusC/RagA family TonB-linked outer membrane protein [Bacteroidota bacterium]